jgi:hypothetical protein
MMHYRSASYLLIVLYQRFIVFRKTRIIFRFNFALHNPARQSHELLRKILVPRSCLPLFLRL